MPRKFFHSLPVLVLSFILFALPAAAAKRALFDNFHAQTAGNADWIIDTEQPIPVPTQSAITASTPDNYWLGAISTYGINLVKLGYTVATNTSALTYQNTSNPYDLSNYDVLIVDEPNSSFSAAEATAILNFVRDGGGLVAISDHSGSDRNSDGVDSPIAWNALDPTHLLGVHFGISTDANNNIVETSSNLNITFGDSIIAGAYGTVGSFAFHNGTTMTLYPAANPSVRGEVWMTGTAKGSTTNAMVASSVYGSGRVLFIGDSSPVDDGTAQPGNSSIFNGWEEATDSTLILNGTLWATRKVTVLDTIPPVITLTSPNGGEDWKAGSTHSITWTASDNAGGVLIDLSLSLDGGATYPTALAGNLANTGSYAWTVNTAEGTAFRIRATARDGANNSAADAGNANFTVSKWHITSTAGSGGSVAPSGITAVSQGAAQLYTLSAFTGFQVANVLVDGLSVGAVASYTFVNVLTNHTLDASFGVRMYTITASAGTHGQISPAGAVMVPYAGSQSFAITADAGFRIAGLTVDGVAVGALSSYTFSNVLAAHTISATFVVSLYTLSVTIDGPGAVAWTPNQVEYAPGTSVTLTATANGAAHFTGWSGALTGITNPASLVLNASAAVVAHFASDQFAVAAVPVVHGTIARQPDLPLYDYFSNVTLTANPRPGYAFSAWAGDQSSTANPLTVTVDGPIYLEADFIPVIDLTAPNGGETMTVGTSANITWAVSDSVPTATVDIELSRTGLGGPYEAIAMGVPNTGLYAWTVAGAGTDSAVVRATVHDADGFTGTDHSTSAFTIHGVLSAPNGRGRDFAIEPLAPNPVSRAARVFFTLPREANVRLTVVDLQGREVARLAEGMMAAGRHSANWTMARGGVTQPGVYLVRLDTPAGRRVRRWVVER